MNPSIDFVPGWSSEHANRAAARLRASRRYCTVAAPTVPPRPAVSLSRYRLNYYIQGSAGTCWIHSVKQLFEVTANSRGYSAFPACRRAIGYAAKQTYEGGGNQSDGGSPTDALMVMTGQGIGVAHESLYPYTDDYTALAQPTPPDVIADALHTHLAAPVKLSTLDEVVALIDRGYATANGYNVPVEFQSSATFVSSVSGVMGGHSQLIWGYILPGVIDEYLWLELENWWDCIYSPLPNSVARLVDGYEPVSPTATTSNWIRADVYSYLCQLDGYAEHVSATDVEGLTSGVVVPCPGFADAFPI